MKLKRKYNKGFTLVELIVVIAIVAILAAVSVVSYMAFIKQANISSDTQLVQQLNTIMLADESLHGVRNNVHETLKAVEENGYIVERLTPTTTGYDIVYDRQSNRFALLDENGSLIYGDSVKTYSNVPDKVWRIATRKDSGLSTKFSNYLAEDFQVPALLTNNQTPYEITTGFDCGKHLESFNLEYVGGANEQSVILRTLGGKITFNKSTDSGVHQGFATETNVLEVKNGTYHEQGIVGRLNYADNDGKIAFDDGAKIYCYMNTSGDANANVASLDKADGARVFTYVDHDGTPNGYSGATIHVNNDKTVSIHDCNHHGTAEDRDLFVYGDYRYFICKMCGGWAKYDASEGNEHPTQALEASSEFVADSEDNPFDISPADIGVDVVDYGFAKSYQDNSGNWIHEVETIAQFKNIVTYEDCKTYTDGLGQITDDAGKIQYPGYLSENTTFLVVSNLDFNKDSIWSSEDHVSIADYIFHGTLKGGLNNTEEKATLSGYYLSDKISSITGDGDMGLFDRVINASFENLIIDDFNFSLDSGEACGFFGAGWKWNTENSDNYINFKNITVNGNCSIRANACAASFIGRARNVNNITCSYCTNNATIIGKGNHVGGFIGQSSEGSGNRYFTFDHCVQNGTLRAGGSSARAGGFVSYYTGGTTHLTITNSQSNGDIYDNGSGNVGGYFIPDEANDNGTGPSAENIEYSNNIVTATLYGNTGLNKVEQRIETLNSISSTLKFEDFPSYTLVTINITGSLDLNFGQIPSDYDNVFIDVSLNTQPVKKATGKANEVATGSMSVYSYSNSNLSGFVNFKALTRAGYFLPSSGMAIPTCDAYDYGYTKFLIDYSHYGIEGYETGYHFDANGGYYLLDNSVTGDSYTVFHQFRQFVTYTITFTKNDNIVAKGCITDKELTDDTLLEAYTPLN